jgi:hypothetical protein
VDVSSAYNDNDGYYNASNYPNFYAFATLQDDGSIAAWGAAVPPEPEIPHALIDPSVSLMAAKADLVE